MTDAEIKRLLTDISPYQAQYNVVPLIDLPGGCLLPSEIDAALNLPNIDLPSINKVCSPAFIEFPAVLDPFFPPENCPTGIKFNPVSINIFGDLTDVQPRASLPISITNQSEVCTFDIQAPDVVIPCFPNGPQVAGSAIIRVIDPNNNTAIDSVLSIVKNGSCNWNLIGDTTISLPTIPCLNGISFAPGVMSVTSTCASLAGYADVKLVTINKNPGADCVYSIQMPDLQIPCYPNGPTVRGGVHLTVTDSANSYTAPVQSATFGSAPNSCCDFNLVGDPILIDIPCKQSGFSVTFDNLEIYDPFLLSSSYTAATITKPTFCSTEVSLPRINIPCSPDGIKFIGPIKFAFQDFLSHNTRRLLNGGTSTDPERTTIDLSGDTGVRRPAESCTWDTGMVIPLPTPLCPGGFTASSSLVIKANSGTVLPSTIGGNLRYNTLSLTKTAPMVDGLQACGFEIGGEINLGIAGFAMSCSSLSVGGQDHINVNIGSSTVGSIGLTTSATGCGFQFTAPTITLPTLNCPSGFTVNNTGLAIVDTAGRPSTTSNLALAADSCGVRLTGTLVLPAAGSSNGSGVTTNNWLPTGSHPFGSGQGSGYQAGDTAMVTTPEGEAIWFTADADISGIDNPAASGNRRAFAIPGTPNSGWTELFSSGSVSPFLLIRCTEPLSDDPFTYAPTDSLPGAGQLVKVIPTSYLFNGTSSTDRVNVLGLNTPFLLPPGYSVFLDVVFDQSNSNGQSQIAFAAIRRSLTTDIAVGAPTMANGSPNPNYVAASAGAFKTLTSDQVTSMNAVLNGTQVYSQTIADDYVGMSVATRDNLFAMHLNCINIIRQKADKLPYQLKTWELIAKAEKGENVTVVQTDGSTKLPKPAAHGMSLVYTDLSGTEHKYTVKQVVNGHLELQVVNFGTNTANMAVKIINKSTLGVTPAYATEDENQRQPDVAIGSANVAGHPEQKYLRFTYSPTITSTLLSPVVDEIAALPSPYNTTAGLKKTLDIGALSNDLQVYYTTDGSIPSINTFKNIHCVRYDPSNPDTTSINANVVKRISWIAVNPEFSIAAPRTIVVSAIKPI